MDDTLIRLKELTAEAEKSDEVLEEKRRLQGAY